MCAARVQSWIKSARLSLAQALVSGISGSSIPAATTAAIATSTVSSSSSANLQRSVSELTGYSEHMLPEKNSIKNGLKPREIPEVKTGSALSKKSHPVFGELVVDLGYKQVYVTSVSSLKGIGVWNLNRAYRQNRAAAIAKDKIASGWRSKVLPGIISCFEFVPRDEAIDKELFTEDESQSKSANQSDTKILDGQHRRGALIFMSERKIWEEENASVLLEVFKLCSETGAKQLFTEINKMEPVRLIDLPDMGSIDVKEALNYAAEKLESEYPEMFKTSSRCRIPHLNVDVFRDELFQSDILTRFHLRTGDDVLQYLKNVNKKMEARSLEQWKEVYKGSASELEKAITKAKKFGFFLGIDRAWMHR